jgi:hypothetical protein
MNDGWLTIFRLGKNHAWSINDGDVDGQDWIAI